RDPRRRAPRLPRGVPRRRAPRLPRGVPRPPLLRTRELLARLLGLRLRSLVPAVLHGVRLRAGERLLGLLFRRRRRRLVLLHGLLILAFDAKTPRTSSGASSR